MVKKIEKEKGKKIYALISEKNSPPKHIDMVYVLGEEEIYQLSSTTEVIKKGFFKSEVKHHFSLKMIAKLSDISNVSVNQEMGYDGAADLFLGAGSSGIRSFYYLSFVFNGVQYKIYLPHDQAQILFQTIADLKQNITNK